MSKVIAGLFDTGPRAHAAIDKLHQAGVSDTDICEFVVNSPGQHDAYPIGGDRDESPGAKHADSGAGTGAAIGGVVGVAAGAAAALAVGPFAIPLAAGVGAYTGSLVGALNGTDDGPNREQQRLRTAGTMVAVNITSSDLDAHAIAQILKDAGAVEVEQAQSDWADGSWNDFDPLSRPQRVDTPPPL